MDSDRKVVPLQVRTALELSPVEEAVEARFLELLDARLGREAAQRRAVLAVEGFCRVLEELNLVYRSHRHGRLLDGDAVFRHCVRELAEGDLWLEDLPPLLLLMQCMGTMRSLGTLTTRGERHHHRLG